MIRRVDRSAFVASLLVGVLGLAAQACNWGCQETRVQLVNSQQSVQTVNLVGPEEGAGPGNVLAPGQTRDIMLCLQKGGAQEFRAISQGQLIGSVRCVAQSSSYDGAAVQVLWTFEGFICQGW